MLTSIVGTIVCLFLSSPVVAITANSDNPMLGTGFSIGNGIIVTNCHVIEDSESITVVTFDRKVFLAEVVAIDRSNDLAFISIPVNLPSVRFAESCDINDSVFTLGNGKGIMSITYGTIGALEIDVTATDSFKNEVFLYDTISADLSIFPGNSGGPLFNEFGEVIGVVTAGIFHKDIGFAIPTEAILGNLPLTESLAAK